MTRYSPDTSMGSGRSLRKLLRNYASIAPGSTNPPSLDGLKYWSKTHQWGRRVAEHDAKVGAAVEAKMAQAQVHERVDAMKGADLLIQLCTSLIEEAVANVTNLRPTDPKELRAIGSTLVEAAKLKELLEGRADSRREHRTPEQLEEALREVRAKLGYPDAIAGSRPTQH